MVGFLVGLIVAMIAASGLAFYFFSNTAEEAPREEEMPEASVNVHTKVLPEGAVMEDGTLPE